MPDADLVIHNGTVVTAETELPGTGIAIEQGTIVEVCPDGRLPGAKRRLDARGNYILPGVIDDHVHFREPGLTYKEDFGTGSLAAVMGGVTCVGDMPNTIPATATAKLVHDKKLLAQAHSYCDFGIYALIAQDNIDELLPMAEAGVIGYKCYLGETTGNIPAPDDGMLLDQMALIASLGLRAGFHAENDAMMQHRIRQLKASGRTDARAHLDSRPAVCEVEAIQRVCLFVRETGCKAHIFHLSSPQGLKMLLDWRGEGIDVTCETGPHYCFLPDDIYERVGSVTRMNPPVRGGGQALLEGLIRGDIECIATDHSPHTPEEKLHDNIWDAVSGFVGVETSVQLFLSEAVNAGKMTLSRFVAASSTNVARTWAMASKGQLAPGFDGDVTIVDLNREWAIDSDQLHSRNHVTPFHGWRGRGQAVATVVRGQVVMEDGQLVGEPQGKMVKGSGA
ncbi:MAG TPA: dihydroorotase family protein [Chloroflexota bacterium]|nr:dihydroorotase family protein [Chloroflexota bacterium]